MAQVFPSPKLTDNYQTLNQQYPGHLTDNRWTIHRRVERSRWWQGPHELRVSSQLVDFPVMSPRPLCWERGSGGVRSAGVSQSVRDTSRDESQNVLSTPKLFKTRDLELPIFRDLSQVVRRTPRDTPVPLYTRTSPFPSCGGKNWVSRVGFLH